jgi:DNA-binding transcriptional LysR family regulator
MSMVDFDLRQLQYFLAAAENLNISAAARKLGMTQPALSRQIKTFEEQAGSALFERGKKSIALTRAGEIMVREGSAIIRSVEVGMKRFRQEVDGAELRVGYAPSLASGLIEKAISCFSSRYPGVRVSWFDSSTQEMWAGLKNETLDLILEVENEDPAIHWQRISNKPFRMAVPPNHPLARRRFLKPEHLDGERLLLLSRHDYPGYWNQVTTYFTDHQIDAKVVGEFDGISSLKMGIEAGLGMAFVAGSPAGLTTIKLRPEPAPLCIAIGSLINRKIAEWEQAFVDEMIEAGNDVVPSAGSRSSLS